MMDSIKQISADFKIPVRQIALKYGIPQRTVEAWSAGDRTPPDYVLKLIRMDLEKRTD